MGAYQDAGQWRWRRQIRLPTGERKRLSGTPEINTKRAALEDEHDAVEAELAGRRVHKAAPTLAAVIDDYLATVKMQRSPALWDNRRSQVKHLLKAFGRTRLDRIDLRMIDRYKADQAAAEYAPGSINQQLLALSNLLRWAKDRSHLRELPKIEKLPLPPKSPEAAALEYLEPEALAVVVAKAADQTRRMVQLAAHTGLRIGELLALRWVDVDFKLGRVLVRRSVYRGKEGLPKGRRSRTVPLTAAALAALKAQRHLRGPHVFCDDDGAPLPYWRALELAQAVGLAGWHILRHTFGTTLSARGVPLRAIQEWMGHADIKTTMVYAHFSPVLDSAIAVLDTGETWQPAANRMAGTPTSGGDSDA